MSFIVPVGDRIVLGSRASVVDEDKLQSWAETYVRHDPDIKWIVGNYIEADRANSNGYQFTMDELKIAKASLGSKPLNMLHHGRYIVGSYAGSEILEPNLPELQAKAKMGDLSAAEELAADPKTTLQALAAFWKNHFPDEYALVQRAHDEGSLFYSMEATPQTLTFPDHGNVTLPFDGVKSDTYPTNEPGHRIILHQSQFHGGALILPPIRPGWTGAEAKTMAALLEKAERDGSAEKLYAGLQQNAPHLDSQQWEGLMGEILANAATYVDKDTRSKMAKTGVAMSDGTYPIPDIPHLKSAIDLRNNGNDPKGEIKAHIIARAKALGATNLLPASWDK